MQLADRPLADGLSGINATLMSLGRFWFQDLRYGARGAPISTSGPK